MSLWHRGAVASVGLDRNLAAWSWHRTPTYGGRDRAPFALIVAITACGTLGMHLIIPALPDTARALNVSPGAIQLTITLYLIGLAIGQLMYGPISDRFGRRPVLLAGLALFTLAGMATTAAPGAWTLVIARMLQSIGACSRPGAGPCNRAQFGRTGSSGCASRDTDDGDVGGASHRAGAGRLCHRVDRMAGGLRAAGHRRRGDTGAGRAAAAGDQPPAVGHARVSLLLGSLRLFRSRAFCGYVLGGAFTTTSFYAFMAASPFILVDLLHQPTERVGLYYLLLMAGVAAGSLLANRVAGRITDAGGVALGEFLGNRGAALFLLADLTAMLNVTTVIAPVVLFMVGAGMASPFALSGAVSVNPHAIGAASGLYGFTQMAYGALCTVIVEIWRPGSVLTVAVVLLGSALLGQLALSFAVQRLRAI